MYVSHDDDDDGDGDQKCQLLVNFFYAILFILAADYFANNAYVIGRLCIMFHFLCASR